MDLEAIRSALRAAGLDGWLFCDHHNRDPLAYRILGLEGGPMVTRRWFYWVPADGEPQKLAHRVEPHRLDALPGRQRHYLRWNELADSLRDMIGAPSRVAMQYSPNNDIPYVSLVDGGTIDLVRGLGHEVVSSAELVQRFEAVLGAAGLERHVRAGEKVQAIKDEAFAFLSDALGVGRSATEYDVRELILRRFAEEGLTADGEIPIVGFNDHPADPHFEPKREGTYAIGRGDTVLIDLWAREDRPDGVYYDITWCGFAGDDPPEEYRRIFEVVRDARDAALGAVRDAFATGREIHGYEVDDLCRGVVDAAGYGDAFVHRTGHSIGREVHGNGVNIDNLETRDVRRIVPGVCFSIEPGIYLPGRMAVRSEIDVFVAPDGEVVVAGPMQRDLVLL